MPDWQRANRDMLSARSISTVRQLAALTPALLARVLVLTICSGAVEAVLGSELSALVLTICLLPTLLLTTHPLCGSISALLLAITGPMCYAHFVPCGRYGAAKLILDTAELAGRLLRLAHAS